MYRSKKEVVNTIKERRVVKDGIEYPMFVAFFGVDPVTKKKVRVARSNLDELKSYITDFYRQLKTGGESAVVLSPYQATDARNAYDLMAQNGISMTLVDCVRSMIDGMKNGKVAADGKISLGEAITKYLATIVSRSKQYQNGMRCHLGRWAASFGSSKSLAEINAPTVKEFLTKEYYNADNQSTWTTYNDVLGNIKTFLRWCASTEQQFISANPIEGMKRLEIGYRQPKYVKAADTEKLFRALEKHKDACPEDLADAILSFMCGMRQAEIARVREGEESVRISFEDRFIRVIKCKGSSRGIRPRAFHIPEQAFAWMNSFDFLAAIKKENPNIRKHLSERAEEAGIDLPKNAGRHTFITMYEAVHHDANALSAIVGNTDGVRSRCYNGVELEREGKAYFAIMPTAPSETQQGHAPADSAEAPQPPDSQDGQVSFAS